MGNGCRIHFWDDHWLGNRCVKSDFPKLYSPSSEKDLSLSMMIERRRNSGSWNLNFRRHLFAWESEELLRLFTTLNQVELLTSNREDHLKWLACSSSKFSVSSLYNLLMPKNSMLVPKLLWNNVAPPKV